MASLANARERDELRAAYRASVRPAGQPAPNAGQGRSDAGDEARLERADDLHGRPGKFRPGDRGGLPRIAAASEYEIVRADDHAESGTWQVLVGRVHVGWIRPTWQDTGSSAARACTSGPYRARKSSAIGSPNEEGRDAPQARHGYSGATDRRNDHANRDQLARVGRVAADARIPGGLGVCQLAAYRPMARDGHRVVGLRRFAHDEEC